MIERIAVDSSALVSILKREPDWRHFFDSIDRNFLVIGWPTIFETRLWAVRNLSVDQQGWFEAFLVDETVTTIPFDGDLEGLAHRAYQQFGKGRHSAKLNFGDCMTYAVARHFDAPLLFKGNDFQHTDVIIHEDSVITA